MSELIVQPLSRMRRPGQIRFLGREDRVRHARWERMRVFPWSVLVAMDDYVGSVADWIGKQAADGFWMFTGDWVQQSPDPLAQRDLVVRAARNVDMQFVGYE